MKTSTQNTMSASSQVPLNSLSTSHPINHVFCWKICAPSSPGKKSWDKPLHCYLLPSQLLKKPFASKCRKISNPQPLQPWHCFLKKNSHWVRRPNASTWWVLGFDLIHTNSFLWMKAIISKEANHFTHFVWSIKFSIGSFLIFWIFIFTSLTEKNLYQWIWMFDKSLPDKSLRSRLESHQALNSGTSVFEPPWGSTHSTRIWNFWDDFWHQKTGRFVSLIPATTLVAAAKKLFTKKRERERERERRKSSLGLGKLTLCRNA